LKIIDFGFATQNEGPIKGKMGTLGCMGPELHMLKSK